LSSLDRIVDTIIQQAIERGDFDNLPNQGKPLDLDDYFNTPEELRLAYSMLKSADILPVEAELFKKIASLQEALQNSPDEAQRQTLQQQIEEKRLQIRMMLERRSG
jgi:hypothetical protein